MIDYNNIKEINQISQRMEKMHLYFINGETHHEEIEGWFEFEYDTIYQCLVDENDPQKSKKFPIAKQCNYKFYRFENINGIYTVLLKHGYDKIQIVAKD
jgi:hypothetical protein